MLGQRSRRGHRGEVMIADDVNLYDLKVGDKLLITQDGKPYEMTVSNILPPMSGGRAQQAGPWIMTHIRPGGYGVGFDYTTRLKVEKA